VERTGRGTASVALRITSGNLRLYRALAAIKVRGADLKLGRRSISIESMEGEIPLTADVMMDQDGFRFVRDMKVNAYSELRFTDQNPLLHRQSFITVKRVSTPLFTVAPLAGNLRVEHNVLSLSQFETGLRQGRVTGQCIIDWRKSDTQVHLHLRASNVRAATGEPFDGNSAVVLSLKDRSVEGRAEILRIGRRHLLDLLDLHDPHHADPAVNRVRRALQLGYPDKVRLVFSHGFANVRVTFGGLARLVHIDELRGIPMGPVIDKLLRPMEENEEEEEP
jgi:translocation and assembly module TamB